MANEEKLMQVLNHIKAHPDLHDQSDWVGETTECGTTMCFAGWTLTLDGHKLEWGFEPGKFGGNESIFIDGIPIHNSPNGTIYEQAMNILELTHSQADALFLDAQTLDAVENTVHDILESQI